MKNLFNKKGLLVGMAFTCTALIMVPLITGAAPLSAPPAGPVVPNFSGLKILDSTSQNNLDISGYGLISNPQAGSSVSVKDTDGLRVYAEGINANYLNFNPNNGINAGNMDAGIQVPLKLNDIVEFFEELRSGTATALRIRHDYGIDFTKGNLPMQTTNLRINNNAEISNPGTGHTGNVYVGDGLEVYSTADVTEDASWLAAGGAQLLNATTMKAQSGVFDLQRVFRQFSPTRKFIDDKFVLDGNGAVWETTDLPTCNPGDGCSWANISRIKQGDRSSAMSLASDFGVSLGYLDDGSLGPLHGFIELLKVSTSGIEAKGEIHNESFWQPPAGDSDMTPHKIKCEQVDKGSFNIAQRKCYLPVNLTDTQGFNVTGKVNANSLATSGNIYSAGTISAAGKITAGGGFGSYYVKNGTNTTVAANSNAAVVVSCDSADDIAVECGYYKQWDTDLHIYSVSASSGNSCTVSAKNWNATTGKWYWPKVKCFTPGA